MVIIVGMVTDLEMTFTSDLFKIAGQNNDFVFKVSLLFALLFNPLPNDKMLDWSRLKAFADDKINVTQILKFVFERTKNILGKGENTCY